MSSLVGGSGADLNNIAFSGTVSVTNDGTFAFESGHNLATVVTDLATVLTELSSILTHIASLDSHLPPATQPVSGSVSVSNFPATQPVSGTVTANAGTNLNTSALALETGGNLATLVTNTTGVPVKFATLKATGDLTTSGSAQKTVTTPLASRQGIYIFNNDSTNNVRWGDSAITTTKGGRIPAGTGLWVAAGPSVDVYVIAEAGSPVVSLTEAA